MDIKRGLAIGLCISADRWAASLEHSARTADGVMLTPGAVGKLSVLLAQLARLVRDSHVHGSRTSPSSKSPSAGSCGDCETDSGTSPTEAKTSSDPQPN